MPRNLAQREGGVAGGRRRWLQAALLALAGTLALNSLLGPLAAGVIDYPLSRTLILQTIGLEAVSLCVVTPWCLTAAWLLHRRHPAGPLVAVPPGAYAAYMFVQYVVGPGYVRYHPWIVLHLVVFVLGAAVLVAGWSSARSVPIPGLSDSRRRAVAAGVLFMAAFTTVQYGPAAAGLVGNASLSGAAAEDPTMYWAIFFLDLGMVVPATVATGVGLLRDASWAGRAAIAVVGWFVLVPISVAAMGIVMVLGGDPNASVFRIAILAIGAIGFVLFAGWVYRPLFGR